jgi:hypothetical protein
VDKGKEQDKRWVLEDEMVKCSEEEGSASILRRLSKVLPA